MVILFKKGFQQKNALVCRRNDGSQSFAQLRPGMVGHDLAHFVVETVLGFQKAFYGLVKSGYSIQDFELPRDKRPTELLPKNLPKEALATEHIVNLLQIEYFNEGSPINFIEQLDVILKENAIPFPEPLSMEALEKIRQKFHQIVQDWRNLKEGQHLEFEFSI